MTYQIRSTETILALDVNTNKRINKYYLIINHFLKSSSVLYGTSFNKPYIIKLKIALIIHDFFKRQK